MSWKVTQAALQKTAHGHRVPGWPSWSGDASRRFCLGFVSGCGFKGLSAGGSRGFTAANDVKTLPVTTADTDPALRVHAACTSALKLLYT